VKYLRIVATGVTLIIMFAYGIFVLAERSSFFLGAKIYHAPIVKIQNEERWKKRKRSWIPIFVPIVEITDDNGAKEIVRVDDYSESPVYRIGDKMGVLYNREYGRCLVNTFSETWGDVVLVWLVVLFLLISLRPMLYRLRGKIHPSKNRDNLYNYKSKLDTFQRRSLEVSKGKPASLRKKARPIKRRAKRR
jgi:hypothetical protein